MTGSSSDNEGSISSASAHSPSEERPPPKGGSPDSEPESLDPEQDALVGEKSLDNRFNRAQLELLVSRKDEYRYAGAKQRKELALRTGETIAAEMMSSGIKMSEADRAGLFENVKLWFSQRARTRKEPLQWTVHWSAREVFYKENKETVIRTQNYMYEAHTGKKASANEVDGLAEVEDVPEQPELPKDKVPQPFHFFQKALTAEWESLSEKERDHYEEKARVWRSLGPDEQERRRLAERHAGSTIRSLATSLYRQMGVRIFVLATWEDTQGRLISVPLDFNHELGSDGRSYKIEHRAYLEKVGLLDHYATFAQKVSTDNPTETDRDVSPTDIVFKTTEEGRAILPDPSVPHGVLKPFKHLPNLIRKFMDADYGLCRGIPVNRKSGHQVPWLQLQTRLDEFINPEYLPDGWTSLKDPGGLGVGNCRLLLNHWWKRQQDGSIPFAFHQWEASPAVYDADGVTLKRPAKMVPRESLPLPEEGDEMEGEAVEEQSRPKAKPKRSRKKKSKPKSSLPTTIPAATSLDKRQQSKSRSPSKGRRSQTNSRSPSKSRRTLSKHARQSTSDMSDEGVVIPEERGRGRAREARKRRRERSNSSDSLTESPDAPESTPTRGRSKGRSTLPDLVNATKDLSLGSTAKDGRGEAGVRDEDGDAKSKTGKGGKVKKASGKGSMAASVAAKNKRAGNGKGRGKSSSRLKAKEMMDLGEDLGEEDEMEEDYNGQYDEEYHEEEDEQKDEEDEHSQLEESQDRGPLRTGNSGSKATTAKDRKAAKVVREKTVKWKDIESNGKEASEDETEPVAQGNKSLARANKKVSAEDRDLLALANSPRYRVDSPTRRRPKSAKVKGV